MLGKANYIVSNQFFKEELKLRVVFQIPTHPKERFFVGMIRLFLGGQGIEHGAY